MFTALVLVFGGPLRESVIFIGTLLSSFHSSISSGTSLQIEKLSNSTELIEKQRAQIDQLKKDLIRARHENNLLLSKVNYADDLNGLLGIAKSRFPRFIGANVLVRSPSSWHQELVLNKGELDGVKAGMVVVSEKGIVGQIQECGRHHSIVQLMASGQVRFGAMVQRSKVMGILFGEKPGYAQLKFLPIGSDIKKGDVIQTTETAQTTSRLYPYAYPVGKVIELSRDKDNSEMFVRVKLFEDTISLNTVLVLADGGLKPSFQPMAEQSLKPMTSSSTVKPTINKQNTSMAKPSVISSPSNAVVPPAPSSGGGNAT